MLHILQKYSCFKDVYLVTVIYVCLRKCVYFRYFSQLVPLELTDNDFGNVFMLDDELYAASETCHVWKINPDDISCKKRVSNFVAKCCRNVKQIPVAFLKLILDQFHFYNLGNSMILFVFPGFLFLLWRFRKRGSIQACS